ncbi:MAG TPA: hypothetical protein VEX88_05310 [Glaciibacter sp.]|nr:hypothetical protein [Glaciibacter sp.]
MSQSHPEKKTDGRGEQSKAAEKSPAHFWPFDGRVAILLAPAIFCVLLVAWVLLRFPLGIGALPAGPVLLAIVILSLLPTLLMVLDGISTRGGSFAVGQVRIALTQAAASQPVVVALRNVSPGTAIGDSASQSIVEGLQDAAAARTVLVDLADGHAWWQSRLLILCSGAVRLGNPHVIVFVGWRAESGSKYIGWAYPRRIRDRILRENPDYALAYERAMGLALAVREQNGTGRPPVPSVPPFIAYPDADPGRLNEFLEEQILANELSRIEHPPRELTVTGLTTLLEPVIRTSAVDRTDLEAEWFRKVLRSDDEYLCVTNSGQYVALISRTEVLSEILLALTAK